MQLLKVEASPQSSKNFYISKQLKNWKCKKKGWKHALKKQIVSDSDNRL